MPLSNRDKKHLRRLGHNLDPVVSVAGSGLSEGVITEIDRALADHELIKVKFVVGDRDIKKRVVAAVCQQTRAELAQMTGHIALLYRKADRHNPRLSNLLR